MDLGVWDGWQPLVRTLIAGPLGYLGVVVLLRTTGKRALSKLNMFDFVITVAMGTTLGAFFTGSVSLIHGIFAFGVLLGVQYVTTLAASRSAAAAGLLMAEPTLLFHQGRFMRDAMRKERVTEGSLRGTVRDSSIGSLDLVAAMVLETDGTVSVIPKDKAGDLAIVPGRPPDPD